MAALHSIPAAEAAPDLLDARDALDDLGDRLALLRLALIGLRANLDATTSRTIDPLLSPSADLLATQQQIARGVKEGWRT